MNQFNLFIVLSLLASLLMVGLAVYAFQFRKNQEAGAFVWLLSFIALWTFSIGVGLLAKTEIFSFRWAILRMVGVTAVPVAWFLFALHFSNRSAWVKKWKIILLAIIPVITISLMITNESHHLFLKGIVFVRNNGYLIDATWQLGPWFWVHLVYSYLLIFIADFILLNEAFRLSSSYRKQTYALIFGTLFPLIVNLFFTFHLLPTVQVNYDPLGFVFAGLIFATALVQWRLLDLRPIAHQLVVESMQDAIFVIDRKERIVDVNPAAEVIFDQQKENIIGQKASLIFPNINLKQGHGKSFTFHPANASQNIYDAQLSPITKIAQIYGYLIILRDITEQKKLENQLIQLANHDALTGLSNRKFFIAEANKELNRALRYQSSFVLGFMDLDNFKSVNDLYGHTAGDVILKRIAQIIQNGLRVFDIAGRYGGDEFIFIFPQTNLIDAEQIIQRLVNEISNINEVEHHQPISISASVGLVSLEEHNYSDLMMLIKLADEKMYEAKRATKNTYIS